MISRTKYEIDNAMIEKLFGSAGLSGVTEIAPLGAGEYNAVFSIQAGGKEYVLKIAPKSDAPVLAYEKNMMAAEVFWYERIREHTRVTVPEVYYADLGRKLIPADYFIMEKLPGLQLDKTEFSEAEKEGAVSEIAKMAAQIHRINNDKFGYVQSGLHNDWYEAIRAMVKSLLSDCARKGKRSRRGVKLLDNIDKYRAVLEKAECSMVNFDLWPSNILCSRENGEIKYAWIDPERSFWGDRMADFVCLETMTPLAEKKKSLAAYNSAADKPVNATFEENIRYAAALGYLALIMETEKYFRYSLLNYGWRRNVSVSKIYFDMAFSILNG